MEPRHLSKKEGDVALFFYIAYAASLATGFQSSYTNNDGYRPFLVLENTREATSQQIQLVYEQGAGVSAVAYLLFAAAEPLSKAKGSSNALLPYVEPLIMRLYVTQPGRCNPSLGEHLYNLSYRLHGTPALQACHYTLYTSLRETFTWVRGNITLRPQTIEGQPLATAAWPDPAQHPAPEFSAAVLAALSDPDQLANTAELLAARCGLAAQDFAALVPTIANILTDLHADLPTLQQISEQLVHSQWAPKGSRVTSERPNVGEMQYRRELASFDYTYPPKEFVVANPTSMQALFIPLVFHILLYEEYEGTIGPPEYDQAALYIERMVRQVNYMAKPTNFQFFVQEVRNDPVVQPNLVIGGYTDWLDSPECEDAWCLRNGAFVSSMVVDFPRAINIFVTSDTTATQTPAGHSNVPGSDTSPVNGIVYISWDSVSPSGFNSHVSYNDGGNTLLHEIFHHLGLHHSFGPTDSETNSCNDDDYVLDTPTAFGSIGSSSFISAAETYCMELFWDKYNGDWEASYIRRSAALGIPKEDMNAWADSCPTRAGYDELGNYMTYNTAVCFAALGHFTAGQAQRAHYMTAELNPLLYAWGQYYAQNSPPPPPQESPPPEAFSNICRTSETNCSCKASWTYQRRNYTYCDQIGNRTSLSCEVMEPSSCLGCAPNSTKCILDCTGTNAQCKKTLYVSPQPPGSPPRPPAPPPPPPRAVPEACKVSTGGCLCRSTWEFKEAFYSYCASLQGYEYLRCEVTSACPGYDRNWPYQSCSSSVNTSICGDGRAYISTTRIPSPPPPPPHPPSPPSLPPPFPNPDPPRPNPRRPPRPSPNPPPSPGPPLHPYPPSPPGPSPKPPSPLPPSPRPPLPPPSPFPPPPPSPSPPRPPSPPPSPFPRPPLYPSPPSPLPPPSPHPSPSPSPQPRSPNPSPPVPSPPPKPHTSPPIAASPPLPPPSPLTLPSVAELTGRVTIGANCNLLTANATDLASDLQAELARLFRLSADGVRVQDFTCSTPTTGTCSLMPTDQVNPDDIRINNLTCGSIIAEYIASFPSGSNASKVLAATAAISSFPTQASSTFIARWGAVTESSTGTVTVLDSSQLCPLGATPSSLCPALPPPPPGQPVKKKNTMKFYMILGAAVGGVVLLVVVATIGVYVANKQRSQAVQRVRVNPRRHQNVPARGPNVAYE